ncbi:uncharacterized protein A4U43_C08F26700 [Asparagus officinalis]|nr:uncharacterized protein A4U43_C08F26700 [Asparagus officinalis]
MGEHEKSQAPMELESEMERLPLARPPSPYLLPPLLLQIFSSVIPLNSQFYEMGASGVCRKWRRAVEQSMAGREKLSFNGWKMDDESTARLVRVAYCLKELDMALPDIFGEVCQQPDIYILVGNDSNH